MVIFGTGTPTVGRAPRKLTSRGRHVRWVRVSIIVSVWRMREERPHSQKPDAGVCSHRHAPRWPVRDHLHRVKARVIEANRKSVGRLSSERPRTGCFRGNNASDLSPAFVNLERRRLPGGEIDRSAGIAREEDCFGPLHCLKGAATEARITFKQGVAPLAVEPSRWLVKCWVVLGWRLIRACRRP